jgi:hypothetical protein
LEQCRKGNRVHKVRIENIFVWKNKKRAALKDYEERKEWKVVQQDFSIISGRKSTSLSSRG